MKSTIFFLVILVILVVINDINGKPMRKGVPIVNIPKSQYSVTVGNSITLTCTVISNSTLVYVNWFKTLENVYIDYYDDYDDPIDLNNNRYSGGGTANTPSLTISNAESGDSGYYTCYAENTFGEGQSQTFLNVEESKVSYQFKAGSECKASCTRVKTGNYHDCESCGSFVSCANGILHKMACPHNLEYDADKKRCEHKSKTCTEIKKP